MDFHFTFVCMYVCMYVGMAGCECECGPESTAVVKGRSPLVEPKLPGRSESPSPRARKQEKVCVYVCMYVCMSLCNPRVRKLVYIYGELVMYLYIYACVYVCMYVAICEYTYVCMY